MLLCMRTTIDMPDPLMRRLKHLAAERKSTLRDLIIQSVEQHLDSPSVSFKMRNASVGRPKDDSVSSQQIQEAISTINEPMFRA